MRFLLEITKKRQLSIDFQDYIFVSVNPYLGQQFSVSYYSLLAKVVENMRVNKNWGDCGKAPLIFVTNTSNRWFIFLSVYVGLSGLLFMYEDNFGSKFQSNY